MKQRVGRAARILAMAAALALPVTGSHAAEAPENWWFYLHNDRVDNLQALLKQGADPNVRFKSGEPAIMRAVVDEAWGVFDLLAADPRIDLNAENPAGETPLMYLAVLGDTERARTLIQRGAKVNRLGWTPLHYAASRGRMDTARLLLDQGAMPNAPSPQGRTPLMMAALSGSQEMVQLLLSHGANPTTQDTHGQDAADWANEGKWTALSNELRRVSDDALRQREGGASGGGRAAAPAPAASPAPAAPPAAPSQPPAAAQEDGSTVRGVSGVRLGTYD